MSELFPFAARKRHIYYDVIIVLHNCVAHHMCGKFKMLITKYIYYLGFFFRDSILIVRFLLTVNEKCINHVQKNYFSKFIVFIKLRKECRKIEVHLVICFSFSSWILWIKSFKICFSYQKFAFCSWSNYKSRFHLRC